MNKEHRDTPQETGTSQETRVEEQFPKPEAYLARLRDSNLEQHAQVYEKVLELSAAIAEAGGRALLVGGSVRDAVLGQAAKDFDIEVYGLPADKVEEITQKFGKVSSVGKAFGILKLGFPGGMDIDVSLPRTDSKIGVGHRGFAVKTDPHMSIEDAARRRDFTMNSLAADPLSGTLYDPFGGVQDLRERRLRITDSERFRDDPLRVMRALQFIARFGLELDQRDTHIIQEMAPLLGELPKERIGEEWKKLLLKSQKPSLGLAAGMGLGIFHILHPELPPLARTQQEPEWHPEGDVWVHTLMVTDEAAKIVRREGLEDEQALVILLAALAHDFGKPAVTEFSEGRLRSRGHEHAGIEPTQKFLTTLGIGGGTREKVTALVAHHLAPSMFFIESVLKKKSTGAADGAIRRLARRIHPATIQELVFTAEADHTGRGVFTDPEDPQQLLLPDGFPAGVWMLERARRLEVEASKPRDLIRGRDLLALGFKPGPMFGKLIESANILRDEREFSAHEVFLALEGVKDEREALKTLDELRLAKEK